MSLGKGRGKERKRGKIYAEGRQRLQGGIGGLEKGEI